MIINNFVPLENIFESTSTSSTNGKSPLNTFQNVLKENLDKVNENQVAADNITTDFISGKDVEVHEMILSMEEAKMSLQLAIQVRNKVVEAVQELNRMQL